MKWIFWSLLVLNGLFYFWQMDKAQLSAFVANPKPQLPSGVARLVLVGEAATSEATVAEAPANLQPPPVHESAEPETIPLTPEDTTETLVEDVALKPSLPASPEPTVAAKPVLEQTCFSLGPFKDYSAAEAVAKALQAFGMAVDHRQQEERIAKGYWVYLPPFGSYVEAKQTVQKLKLKGISDMFIMGRGEYQHAISLGLFNSEATAQQRFEEIKALEPGVVLAPQYRVTNHEWLDLLVVGDTLEKVAEIAGVLQDLPGATLSEPKVCK